MNSAGDISLDKVKPVKRPQILFPNEHGAWGMFATAFILGWLSSPILSWRPLLLLPAAVGAFLARYPIGLYFKKRRVTRAMRIPLTRERKWFWIYSVLTLLVAIPLLYPLGWWWLLIFAGLSSLALILHLRSIIQRKERSFFSEFTAMTGISFLAPAASYAALLRFTWNPILIWLLLILFYTQRIVAVRHKVAGRERQPIDIRRVGKRELLYSLIFVVITAGIARLFYL